MHVAAAEGHVDIIEELNAAQVIHDAARDGDKKTPLHLAARNGHVKAVECLMQIACNREKAEAANASKEASVEEYSYLDEAILNDCKYGIIITTLS